MAFSIAEFKKRAPRLRRKAHSLRVYFGRVARGTMNQPPPRKGVSRKRVLPGEAVRGLPEGFVNEDEGDDVET